MIPALEPYWVRQALLSLGPMTVEEVYGEFNHWEVADIRHALDVMTDAGLVSVDAEGRYQAI